MPNVVQHFRTPVAGRRPTNRDPGELWINFAESVLGYIDDAGQPVDLTTVPVTIGDTPPVSPKPGSLWFDSVGGQLYVSYDDGSSQQWVIAVNTPPPALPPLDFLPLTGGTLTGNLFGTSVVLDGGLNAEGTIEGKNGLVLEKPIGEGRYITGNVAAGVTRWLLTLGDTTPECNFAINRFDDAGANLSTVVQISRVTGEITLDGNLNIAKQQPIITMNRLVNSDGAYLIGQNGGQVRWQVVLGDPTLEAGSNTGSNFTINRFDDAGAFLDASVTVARATGVVNFSQPPTVNGVPVAMLDEIDELRERLKALEDQIAQPRGERR